MLDEPEVIRQQMHETRSALTEKLETLEQQVVDTVAGAQTAVAETVENVKDAVQETVDVVKGSVQEGVESVRRAFDLPHQMQEYPWLFVGGSVALGYLCGSLCTGTSSRRGDYFKQAFVSPHGGANGNNGAAEYSPQSFKEEARPRSEKPGWFGSLAKNFSAEIDKVKSLAIGVGVGLVRDMIAQAAPDQMRPRVSEIMNDLTTRLGGETIRGPILSPTSADAYGPR